MFRHLLDCENGGPGGKWTGLRSLRLVSDLVDRLESPSKPVSGLQLAALELEHRNRQISQSY